MLKLTTPKKSTNLFYVSSESEPNAEPHILVKHGPLFFCDCRDFMVRKLPLLGTASFSHCKHGKFVADVLKIVPEGTTPVFAFRDNQNTSVVATGMRSPK